MSNQLPTESFQCLRLILGDQLNARHSWFSRKEPNALYVIAELQQALLTQADYYIDNLETL